MEQVTHFDKTFDDPLFREHLDDRYFDPDHNSIGTPNYTRRLVCQFLMRIISNEQRTRELKLDLLRLMAE